MVTPTFSFFKNQFFIIKSKSHHLSEDTSEKCKSPNNNNKLKTKQKKKLEITSDPPKKLSSKQNV